MKTNFFENIAGLNAPGLWKIGIHQDDNGRFVVSALYSPQETPDPATKTIAPLIFRGTAEEMGEGFFEAIEKPVQETAGLYHNIAEYSKTVEAAKKKVAQGNKNQSVKPKAESTENEEDGIEEGAPKISAGDKKKAYTDAIRKVVELNDACKYEDALNILPSVTDYPEKKEELEKRRTDLERKKTQYAQALQLFNQD
ncbi:MAG TPA: PRTRC system protein E [Mucilaginibacter sp.]|jgi:PRTRC genetic system protein E